ncbi:FecR family protein [Asticcacaulis excentricus]|nr:FecR domain-containing protein [Asticcacaulis excentricus]
MMDRPQTADEWFVRLNSGLPASPEDDAAFRLWLSEDPLNEKAYRDCQMRWMQLGAIGQSPEILARRASALKAAAGTHSRRDWLRWAGGGVAAAVTGGVVYAGFAPSRAWAKYATGVGQRLTVPLSDGSELTLAPLSRVRARFADGKRTIELQDGQIFVRAARKTTPLTVKAGACTISGSGCQLQVTHDAGKAEVLVADGGAKVTAQGGRTRQLWSGQKLDGDMATARVQAVDVRVATEWRMGRLVFSDQPLSEVVADFNRYSVEQFTIADPSLGTLRLSGSFRYDGVEDFPQALESVLGLSVEPDGANRWRITSR